MLGLWKSVHKHQDEPSTGYEKLLTDNISAEEQPQLDHTSIRRSQRSSYVRHILIDLGVLVIVVIAFFCWSYVHEHNQSKSLEWTPCGNTSAEARAAGCLYEPMQRSWIPKACYLGDIVNDYHPFDDRKWFYDLNLTQPLDEEGMHKLRTGDDLLAYAPFFHNEHCVYCWRKLAIAVERRLPMIDSKTANFHHSTHCAHLLSEEVFNVGNGRVKQYWHQSTKSPLMFQTCVPLNWR